MARGIMGQPDSKTGTLKALALLVGLALCWIALSISQAQDKKSFDQESIKQHLEFMERLQKEKFAQAPVVDPKLNVLDKVARFQGLSHGGTLYILDTMSGKLWSVEKGRWNLAVDPTK